MTNEQKTECRKIFRHFGFNDQFDKMIEEFEEYKNAINIFLSDPTEEHMNDLIFEKADLEIMVNQLLYGTIAIKSELSPQHIDKINNNAVKYKIKRTLDRIESRYYEGDK